MDKPIQIALVSLRVFEQSLGMPLPAFKSG
jgi:hypothetical protein